MNNLVYVVGILLQGLGGIIALLQVPRAPRKLPWLLIAISALLIVYRRAATLGEFIRADRPLAGAEILTLLISLLFFVGVLLMSQMFSEVLNSRVRLKKSEEELRLAIAKLDRKVREQAIVDTFTYSVSHDLRAPLRRIIGFSEALLEEYPDKIDQQGKDYLYRIDRQVKAMDKLILALLDLSSIARHEMVFEEVDLNALSRSYLETLQYKEPLRHFELITEPDLTVNGDTVLLTTLLEKLLDNAWEYTATAETTVIELGKTTSEGKTVFYLRDNGEGFDMQQVDQLFMPFRKLHPDEEHPGSGIGLNIAHRIITRHGGEIWAESNPGKGAVFFFTI
jgi:signal transduction histidine kinase